MELVQRARQIGAVLAHAPLRHEEHPRQHFDAQGSDPTVHVTRVEPAFGDVYGVCACGARSTPKDSADEAAVWDCPRAYVEAEVMHLRRRLGDVAEEKVALAASLWRQRVSDAQMSGYSR